MAWLGTWKKRIRISIDNGDIDSALSNFPILVYLSASSGINSDDISFIFDELESDNNRKKIAVTKDDGTTQCYVEIEKWDHSSETAWLHIKVPNVSNSIDTILYLYYDSSKNDNDTYIEDKGLRTEVWDSNFKRVLHLDDIPSNNVTDWKSPGTCANVDRNGRNSWNNVNLAKISDDSRASCDVGADDYSDWLRCTNFGFTISDIPSGSVIYGIEVSIERRGEAADIDDSSLRLRKTSGVVGDDKASGNNWPVADEIVTYGGETDSWNAGLIDTDIRDSNFGIDLSAHNEHESLETYARVDHVQIRIYYNDIIDSTSNSGHGKTINMTSGDQVSGMVDGSLDCDGINDHINLGAECMVTGDNWTLEFLIRPNSPDTYSRIFMQGLLGCDSRQLQAKWYGDHVEVQEETTGASGECDAATNIITDDGSTWSYVSWTYNGSSHLLRVNGVSSSSTPQDLNSGIGGNNYIGCREGDSNFWTGGIDEVRLSDNVRVPAWLDATYDSLNDHLLNFGNEERYINQIFFGCNF